MKIDDQQKQEIIDEWKHEQMQKYFRSGDTLCPWCDHKLVKKHEGLVCKTGCMTCPFYFKCGRGWVLVKDDFQNHAVEKMFIDSSRLRLAKEWIELKERILRRDGYRCQNESCQYYLKNDWQMKVGLQVHHIIPVSRNNALYLDEENLITLCNDCHKKIHSGDKHRWKESNQ